MNASQQPRLLNQNQNNNIYSSYPSSSPSIPLPSSQSNYNNNNNMMMMNVPPPITSNGGGGGNSVGQKVPKSPRVIPLPIEQEQLTMQQQYVMQPRWIPVSNLIMSSKYNTCSNMVHSLSEGDTKEGFSGVCTTNNTNNEFIQVSFSSDHSLVAQITRMILRPCTKETWGPTYLNDCSIEYKSSSQNTSGTSNSEPWKFLCKIKLDASGMMDITSPQPIPISTLRITPPKGSQYVGLGIWKFYGILNDTSSLCNEFYREPFTNNCNNINNNSSNNNNNGNSGWNTRGSTISLIDEYGNELGGNNGGGSIMYCIPYQLMMSSYYCSKDDSGLSNTFFELMNDSNDRDGAGTLDEEEPYIQANLKSPQYVTHIQCKANLGQGWGFDNYFEGSIIQYSKDGLNWERLVQISDSNRYVYTLPFPICAAFWRIYKPKGGYLSVSAFKLYTLKSYYNYNSIPVSLPVIDQAIPFKPQISSLYAGLSLSYEGLQDESGVFGCGTSKSATKSEYHHLIASFDSIYNIKLIKMRSLRSGSWGCPYSDGIFIQYSSDAVVDNSTTEWKDFREADILSDDLKLIYINSMTMMARHVRLLIQNEDYLSIGTLKFYGDRV